MKPKLILVALSFALTCIVAVSASAQTSSPSSAKKPNILVIFGDDVGQANISAYAEAWLVTRHQTLIASRRKACSLPTITPRTVAPPGARPSSPDKLRAHGTLQSGFPGRGGGPSESGHHHRPGDQAAGLRYRPVWQKSSRGSRMNFCRRCTASMSSLAISIISTPRRNRSSLMAEEPERSHPETLHPARRAQLQGQR